LLFGILILTIAPRSLAQEKATEGDLSPDRLFSRGNDYYEKGEYDKAIEAYKKILAGGNESGALYFNLANAYFKSNRLGKAILNYERARRLLPRDADLAGNYKFASATIAGKAVPDKGIWAWHPVRMYSGNFTQDELTWVASAAYVLILVLIFISFVIPMTKRASILAVILLAFYLTFNVAVIWKNARDIRTGAIVVVPRAEVLFGPFESATKFFTLHEGMKVTVVSTKEGWDKIRRPDGKFGWIRMSDVEKI